MLTKYDPDRAPDPEEWLALDEMTRMDLVSQYHRKHRVRLPNVQAHAVIHTIMENQVALGDEIPVAATLRRPMAEGLDRHDAVHAIGSVLARHSTTSSGTVPIPVPTSTPPTTASSRR